MIFSIECSKNSYRNHGKWFLIWILILLMSIRKSKHYRIIHAHERPLELMEPMHSCTAKKKYCPCNWLNRVNPRIYWPFPLLHFLHKQHWHSSKMRKVKLILRSPEIVLNRNNTFIKKYERIGEKIVLQRFPLSPSTIESLLYSQNVQQIWISLSTLVFSYYMTLTN